MQANIMVHHFMNYNHVNDNYGRTSDSKSQNRNIQTLNTTISNTKLLMKKMEVLFFLSVPMMARTFF